MIDQGNLDAVVVVTPDDMHHEVTLYALDARLHVLCEKPLALTEQQAREMYTRAEAAGVKHMAFFNWRWMPHYQYMRRLMDEGYIGRPFHLQMDLIAGFAAQPRYSWRFDRRRANGALGDLGSHMLDLARWYMGDITRVMGHTAVHVQRPGPDGQALDPANDAAALLLEFANGAQGVLQVSAVGHEGRRAFEQHVSVHGEGGRLEASLVFNGEIGLQGGRRDENSIQSLPLPDDIWPNVDKSASFREQHGQAFTREAIGPRLFIDAILHDRPVAPSFYDGWKVQQVIQAATESARTGCWVSLD